MAGVEGGPIRTAVLVTVIAAAAWLGISASHNYSKERIAANRRARLIASLNSVLDPALRERDLATARIGVTDKELLGNEPVDVYVAEDRGTPVAVVFATTETEGYNSTIRLLVGVSRDGVLTGVRAVSHRETPGLGDAIDIQKSTWITQFDGKSLDAPDRALWLVDKDDGKFDSITGATVTSRSVVKGVKNTLLYFERHRDELFTAAAAARSHDDAEQ
jgi:H+/Na+-translocating ferredoxin:NAD+ oxidoreductase subunit G